MPDTSAETRIFVYGTLKPGQGNYPRFAQFFAREEAATVKGALFNPPHGGFPYALISDQEYVPEGFIAPASRIHGVLLTVKEGMDDEALDALDVLEGTAYGHYERVIVPAFIALDGDVEEVDTYMYVAGPNTVDLICKDGSLFTLIEGGNWNE